MCPVYWVLGSGVKLDVKHFECRNLEWGVGHANSAPSKVRAEAYLLNEVWRAASALVRGAYLL